MGRTLVVPVGGYSSGKNELVKGRDAMSIYSSKLRAPPERAPLPYTAEEVADVAYNAWKRSGGYDGSWKEVAKAVLDVFGSYPPAEPTLDEIRALAAKHGMVLEFDPAHVLLKPLSITSKKLPLSKAAKDARRPLPPDVLADALQDAVHKEVGKTRPAKSVRSLAEMERPIGKYWEENAVSSTDPVCAVKLDLWPSQEDRERTPASLTAPLSAPDARFGGGR